MKVVILAGGLGTRLSEETVIRPKPMVEIGGKPIIWHIMKTFSYYGMNDFIICCGYKGYFIKEYFFNYLYHNSDVEVDLKKGTTKVLNKTVEPWKITLVDTGENSGTGGRLLYLRDFLKDDFCFTYGDGVSNVDIKSLINFHKKSDNIATVTAVKPPGRFGALEIEKKNVIKFHEKPAGDGSYINGGFFVLSPEVLNYIKNKEQAWESEPLEAIAKEKKLGAFIHDDFWQPMDTLRNKNYLESLWESGNPPWKVWK